MSSQDVSCHSLLLLFSTTSFHANIPKTVSLGKTELTVLPRDLFTDLYAATATLWKVEVTVSNV
jgi:hypothetical protein